MQGKHRVSRDSCNSDKGPSSSQTSFLNTSAFSKRTVGASVSSDSFSYREMVDADGKVIWECSICTLFNQVFSLLFQSCALFSNISSIRFIYLSILMSYLTIISVYIGIESSINSLSTYHINILELLEVVLIVRSSLDAVYHAYHVILPCIF